MPILLILSLAVAAQAATVQPSPDTDRAAAVAAVDAALAGVSARDEGAVLAQLRPTGTATVLMEQADGSTTVRSFELKAYAHAVPGPERYEERMPDPRVEIDGAMATVRGRYTFAIDGKLQHCGFEHFELVRDGGRWKIQNITWTVRTTNCSD
ncbi:MAG: nuclear transport factor 2 family protein [Rhodanobacter sp.]